MTSEPATQEYFATLQRFFDRTPAMSFMKQHLDELAPGRARIILEPNQQYHNGGGITHGGLVATVLDSVGWFACATLSEGYWLMTVEFKVNFLGFTSHEPVIGTGEVLKKGSELFHTRMDAKGQDGRHVATALGSYVLLPRKFST